VEVLVRRLLGLALPFVVAIGLAGCSKSADPTNPGLAPRGTTMTTVTPTRQDLSNSVSLTGKVTLNPVFGIVAPIAGQVRYLEVPAPTSTPTKPTKVANIYVGSKATKVEVPAGATFAGRLTDDRSTVAAGVPIASAKYVGYGIAADINAADAYRISDAISPTVQAQILNGPGPFPCTVLGPIAALPAGTIPDPPADPAADPATNPTANPAIQFGQGQAQTPSEPTGLRVVCTAPADVKLINGASATLAIVTARATNVLVLPVEAVAGAQGKGQVDIVKPDGTKETRDVVLGLSDGRMVEIKSGLTGTEIIAVPGPNLPPAQPQPGDPNVPGVNFK
jgi:hypothetical protein